MAGIRAGDWPAAAATRMAPAVINVGMTHVARVYDYRWLPAETLDLADPGVAAEQVTVRSRPDVAPFFHSLDMVNTGVGQVHRPRPAPANPLPFVTFRTTAR